MISETQSPQSSAHTLLKQWDCRKPPSAEHVDRDELRNALILLTHHSDYQILGICADSLAQGIKALTDYAVALQLPLPNAWPEPFTGAVYLKLNPRLGRCHSDAYTGDHRGVLVSYQSAYDGGVNELYGHLPLDLFS